MTTLSDFLDGLPLSYRSGRRECEAVYRVDDGIYLTVAGEDAGKVETDDVGARRVYWNLTGGKRDK